MVFIDSYFHLDRLTYIARKPSKRGGNWDSALRLCQQMDDKHCQNHAIPKA
jgi:hypothetical protein